MQYRPNFIFIFAYQRPIERNLIILITPETNSFYDRGVTFQILMEKVLKIFQVYRLDY